MLAATKVKMSGSGKKSEQDHRQHFLHKTRNYRKFHVVVVQSNVKEIYRKSVLQVACLLIRPIVFFFAVFVAVATWSALPDFIFCFSKL